MTDKPCCETCSIPKELVLDASKISSRDPNHNPYPHVYDCPIKKRWMNADDVCLSHPQAREYLMKDVINELERRKVDTGSYDTARVYGIAIKLIKEGVKK